MHVNYPLSLRNEEDLLSERGSDLCHETVRMCWNRFGPLFAADIRGQRISKMRGFRDWRWHLDEMSAKLNGEMVMCDAWSTNRTARWGLVIRLG